MRKPKWVMVVALIAIGAAAAIWVANLKAEDDTNPIGHPANQQVQSADSRLPVIDQGANGQENQGPPAGAACVVYLRGDAAGAAWHDRIVDLDNLITRTGTCIRSNESWLVLKDGNKEYYIPRASIMLVEVGKQKVRNLDQRP